MGVGREKMLGISLTTIVILLEDGTIPYEVQLDQNRFIKLG